MKNPEFKGVGDAEMIANARMMVLELSKMHMELVSRGVTVDAACYDSGRVEVAYKRVTEVPL